MREIPKSDVGGGQQVVRNPRTGSLFCVGWINGTVLRSTDNGKSWIGTYSWFTSVTRKKAGLYALSNGTMVYIGQTTYNLHLAFTSTDDGLTWNRLVRDTAMVIDSFGYMPFFVPPDAVIISKDTVKGFATIDGGRTWKAYRTEKLDSSIGTYEQITVAPNVGAIRNKPTWLRMNFAADTGWTPCVVPYGCRKWVELSNGVIVGLMSYNCVWKDTRSSDTSWHTISSVRDNALDTSYALKTWEIIRANDSVAYVITSNGLILQFTSATRTLSLHHRVKFRSDQSLFTKVLSPRQGSTVFIRFLLSSNQASVHEEAWITIANATGVVREQRTKGWATFEERYMNQIIYPDGPVSFINDSLVFVVGDWPNRREYARTTDLGKSWGYVDNMSLKDFDPAYQSILSSTVLPSGERILQTDGDILLQESRDGFNAITQGATSWGADIVSMWFFRDIASPPVQRRMPQIIVDNGSTIVSRKYLLRIDPTTGSTIDTVLPRRALFMRRFTPEMVAAGADSLWISFNNMKEFVYVPAIGDVPPGQQRPTISDVSRAIDGTLYCALRGYSKRNAAGDEYVFAPGGMSISTNDGNTWSMSPGWPERFDHVTTVTTLRNGDVLACAQDVVFDSLKNNGSTTFLKGNEMQRAYMLRSTDRGQTWNVVFTDFAAGILYPTFDPAIVQLADGRVIATTFNGNILESSTNGRTWAPFEIAELGTAVVNTVDIESDYSLIFNTSQGVGRLIVPTTSVASEQPLSRIDARITPSGLLVVNATTDIDRISLQTIDGRSIMESTTTTSSSTINVSTVASGVYVVTASWQGSKVARALVVKP
ncbi:hypothetical protein BH10BAC6_BH10BAC6_02330 [soil metagenome]